MTVQNDAFTAASEPRFAVGFVGGARRDAVSDRDGWEMLTCDVGPCGHSRDMAKLMKVIEVAKQAGRERVADAIRAAIAAVPTTERDTLRKRLADVASEYVKATQVKSAALKAFDVAVASGGPELDHETRADEAHANTKRLARRRDALQAAISDAEKKLQAAHAAARAEALVKLKAELHAMLRERQQEVGNALAAALPDILTARTVLEESMY